VSVGECGVRRGHVLVLGLQAGPVGIEVGG
jgi:hypothetical protein